MGENTKIEWTDHTFNIAWGCERVSPACDHCYAEAWAKRAGLAVWGKDAPRRVMSAEHWKAPLKWNAAEHGGGAAGPGLLPVLWHREPRVNVPVPPGALGNRGWNREQAVKAALRKAGLR